MPSVGDIPSLHLLYVEAWREIICSHTHTLLAPFFFWYSSKMQSVWVPGSQKQHMFPHLPIKPASLPDHIALVITLKALCVTPTCFGYYNTLFVVSPLPYSNI